jgi:two-component system phosphate regulon sensor histidine kinase PhoR
LALVKHVLNRHGGRLSIDSVLGQGASFVMHLPLRTAETGESK